jgi:phosphopentomutase
MPTCDLKRAIVIVLDGCGIGEAPDTATYGDAGSNTIVNTARAVGGLLCPNLGRLGLGHLDDIPGVAPDPSPIGCYGKMQERAAGKDSTSGHWELMGVTLTQPLPVYPIGFGSHIMAPFIERTGRDVIGNKPASGTAIIDELGEEQLKTGKWIVYTSADSVFQIAAHEELIPVEELYNACRIAREILKGKDAVGRVIARPYVGSPGSFTRTHRRRDFSLEPTGTTVLDRLMHAGIPTIGIGKIDDLFAGRGLSVKIHTENNADGMARTLAALTAHASGLIFTNLVEFDMIWGHRNDPEGFARGLAEFDGWLPELLSAMRDSDALFIVADHGIDPTTPSTDHSRELIPLLVYGPALQKGANLGTRATYADLAATLAEAFALPLAAIDQTGRSSFLNMITL